MLFRDSLEEQKLAADINRKLGYHRARRDLLTWTRSKRRFIRLFGFSLFVKHFCVADQYKKYCTLMYIKVHKGFRNRLLTIRYHADEKNWYGRLLSGFNLCSFLLDERSCWVSWCSAPPGSLYPRWSPVWRPVSASGRTGHLPPCPRSRRCWSSVDWRAVNARPPPHLLEMKIWIPPHQNDQDLTRVVTRLFRLHK